MLFFDELCQTASAEIAVPAQRAFEYLTDPRSQSEWTLGAWNRRVMGDGLSSGTSLFTGEEVFVRTESDPDRLLVDYWVGPSPDRLRRLVAARVVPSRDLGRDESGCIVTLTTWRDGTREEWLARVETHHVEVRMIKAQLERSIRR